MAVVVPVSEDKLDCGGFPASDGMAALRLSIVFAAVSASSDDARMGGDDAASVVLEQLLFMSVFVLVLKTAAAASIPVAPVTSSVSIMALLILHNLPAGCC